jgi:hypothetical protein
MFPYSITCCHLPVRSINDISKSKLEYLRCCFSCSIHFFHEGSTNWSKGRAKAFKQSFFIFLTILKTNTYLKYKVACLLEKNKKSCGQPKSTNYYTYQCLPATWDYQLWQRKDNDIGVVIDQNSNNFFNRAENKQKT